MSLPGFAADKTLYQSIGRYPIYAYRYAGISKIQVLPQVHIECYNYLHRCIADCSFDCRHMDVSSCGACLDNCAEGYGFCDAIYNLISFASV
jgi:hypothetical protein